MTRAACNGHPWQSCTADGWRLEANGGQTPSFVVVGWADERLEPCHHAFMDQPRTSAHTPHPTSPPHTLALPPPASPLLQPLQTIAASPNTPFRGGDQKQGVPSVRQAYLSREAQVGGGGDSHGLQALEGGTHVPHLPGYGPILRHGRLELLLCLRIGRVYCPQGLGGRGGWQRVCGVWSLGRVGWCTRGEA